ncbi:MAG: TonB-dependent receptor plug domain-containing protein, partial [Muriicola sp.]
QTLRSQSYVNDLSVLTGNFSDMFKSGSKSSIPEKILFNFQKGLEFYGQAYDLNNSLLTNTKIQVLLTTSDDVVVKEAETNSDGLFTLSGIQISGEITMVFRTVGEETKTKLVKVIPYEYEIPPLHEGAESSKAIEKNSKLSNNLLPKKPMRLFSSMEEAERLIMLNEITLVATKELERESPSIYNLEPTRLIHQNPDKPKTIPQLFLNIPGIQVSGLGDLYPSLSIPRAAGLGPLLWVIDGFPLNQDTNLVDIMNLLSYSDVDRIEILIGAEASMYGSRASGGVISIYTRSGATNEYLNRKDAQITYQGFHESVNFSAYQEGGNWNRKNVADRSTTFYWDPYLQTDDNGEAIISLSTPTQVNQIKIEANAFTENGLRGNLITIF